MNESDSSASGFVPDFVVQYSRNADGCVVVSGEIDMAVAELVKTFLLDGIGPLELDLSGVTFIDSTGIRLLVDAQQVRTVRITAASPAVIRVLEIVGLTNVFMD